MNIYLSMSLTGLQADAATFRCKQQPIVTYRMQPTVAYSSQHAKVAISSQRLHTAANKCMLQQTVACSRQQLHTTFNGCLQQAKKLHTAGKSCIHQAKYIYM